jgi:glycosyltransferase involved in cell wall biosynthesis
MVGFYKNYGSQGKPMLGLGVITYNRKDSLAKCIQSILNNVSVPFDLVVADDGSPDDTQAYCRTMGIPLLGGVNRGISWNKNRALYSLLSLSICDIIVLIEDDCLVTDKDWANVWINATKRYGHINAVHPSTRASLNAGIRPKEILAGSDTAEDPYACMKISGMMISSTRDALNRVGYFDTRFIGYGHEHAEWTSRFRRIGYGVRKVEDNGKSIKANAMLSFGVQSQDVPSTSVKDTVSHNKLTYDSIKRESIYRHPWRNEIEQANLNNEMSTGLGIYFVDLAEIKDQIQLSAVNAQLRPEEYIRQCMISQVKNAV